MKREAVSESRVWRGLVAPGERRLASAAVAAPDKVPPGGVPRPTVTRLPLYRRALAMLTERGVDHVSSTQLAAVVGVTPATLRRDLSRLGSYGTRGSGYDVATLLGRVDRALALDREWPVVIVGVGNLGRALAGSQGFGSGGFRVAALADVSTRLSSERPSVGCSSSTSISSRSPAVGNRSPSA